MMEIKQEQNWQEKHNAVGAPRNRGENIKLQLQYIGKNLPKKVDRSFGNNFLGQRENELFLEVISINGTLKIILQTCDISLHKSLKEAMKAHEGVMECDCDKNIDYYTIEIFKSNSEGISSQGLFMTRN